MRLLYLITNREVVNIEIKKNERVILILTKTIL